DLILLRPAVGDAAEELIKSCREKWNRVAMLALLCPASEDSARDLAPVLNGVDDFLSCPFRDVDLILRVKRLLQKKRPNAASSVVQDPKEKSLHSPLVGRSPCFLRIMEKIPCLAHADSTVLISGETGSGKEVIARAIHYESPRQGKPFIPVNCGALPDHL